MAASSSWFWGALLALTLLVLAPHPAQSRTDQQVSFRLSRIETDVRSLRSQINQLDSAIGRLQRQEGGVIVESAPAPSPSGSPAASFDQLATLVIETRQDVFVLEAQLGQLEAQLETISRVGGETP